jgi:hypothetical protein
MKWLINQCLIQSNTFCLLVHVLNISFERGLLFLRCLYLPINVFLHFLVMVWKNVFSIVQIISATPYRVPKCPSAWGYVNSKSTSDPSLVRLVLICKQFALIRVDLLMSLPFWLLYTWQSVTLTNGANISYVVSASNLPNVIQLLFSTYNLHNISAGKNYLQVIYIKQNNTTASYIRKPPLRV